MEPTGFKNYSFDGKMLWKDTLSDEHLPFSNMEPSLKEYTQDQLKKKNAVVQFNFSDDDVFRTLKGKPSPVFNIGKLVYNTKDDKWYKVLDLKTDDNSNPTWVSLTERNGTETIEISTQERFDEFESCLDILIDINTTSGIKTIMEVSPKIYERLNVSLENSLDGIGASVSSYKFFFNGKEVDKEDCIANIEGITRGSIIFGSECYGKPFKFSRFQEIYPNSYWSNSGRSSDGVCFVPSKNIILCGFSTCAARDHSQYEMKYQVKVNDTEVEEDTIIASGWEDEFYYRHKLNEVRSVKAGQKIEIVVWIAKNISTNDELSTYNGSGGDDYEKIENEHMGLFKIENSNNSNNGTSVGYGHFPEIFYFLG
ncbi:unnamed protein product [Moneuplotes crassus]|uniref:PHR domain-containing protein n=1 Tax=Euplotes crassus TaxID=5936 RepID=A0AAD1XJA0_EUPCR|nr:unnamed protein product [Moneuplotes crassus]